MCLNAEFFEGRDALIKRQEAAGHVELENFLEARGLDLDLLYELGLLKDDRGYLTTADFFPHQLTAKGRRFLKHAAYQVIFVRREELDGFSRLLGGDLPTAPRVVSTIPFAGFNPAP